MTRSELNGILQDKPGADRAKGAMIHAAVNGVRDMIMPPKWGCAT
jgi:hypothetical protein